MSEDQFDVIVVGAGMAGLACAAELTLRGKRPLLICETKEVAQTLHTVWVDGNRGLMHHPSIQTGWGGGWWNHLVRQLDIDVNVTHFCATLDATVRGSGVINHLPAACYSASSLVNMFTTFSPIPLEGIREPLTKVLHAALAIPFEELLTMDRVPFAAWLEEQGADELVAMLLLTFCGQVSLLTADEARQHLSVFGALGPLRTMVCGEAILCVVAPDAREGIAIPIAQEIERRGGEVWRGRRVARIEAGWGPWSSPTGPRSAPRSWPSPPGTRGFPDCSRPCRPSSKPPSPTKWERAAGSSAPSPSSTSR
jgi:hypothetical protein